MATRQRKNTRRHRVLIPVMCLTLSAYFFHHAMTGKLGLESQSRAFDQALELQFQIADLERVREELANRVALLRNGSLERDMLDEQVRYQLNMVHHDEIIVMR